MTPYGDTDLNLLVYNFIQISQEPITILLVLQKRIVRIISGVPRLTHTEPIFVKLGFLTVNRLFKYNIALLMYKYHHSMLPPVLDMFVKNCQVHSYNTRQSDHLHVPQCWTELVKMSFKYQAVMVWNHIYQSVDVNIGIGTFKRHLKSHLLSIISWIIIVSTVCVFSPVCLQDLLINKAWFNNWSTLCTFYAPLHLHPELNMRISYGGI